MSITANKFRGVRAATCNDAVTAEISRRHNDANVLCLAGDLLGQRNIDRLIEIWIDTKFEGGRHAGDSRKSPRSSTANLTRSPGRCLRQRPDRPATGAPQVVRRRQLPLWRSYRSCRDHLADLRGNGFGLALQALAG